MGAHAGVAAADIEVVARAAASLDLPGARLETGHERVGGIGPDLRERPVLYVAEAVVPPEGVGMNLAEVVDVGDVHARGVATPLRELGTHVLFPLREVF